MEEPNMRTAAQRIKKYNARMVSSQLDPVRAAATAAAQTNYAGYATEFVPYQEKLRVQLADLGIDTAQFVFYEAFNGELYHLWKTTSGASLIKAAGVVISRWASASRLGADHLAQLKALANAVFSIVVP
jgi:hypothetical protein